jgi:hypothetical protein
MNQNKFLILIAILLASCAGPGQKNKDTNNNKKEMKMGADSINQYGYNRDFLKKYTSIIELRNKNSAILIAPQWQGRIMTSTSEGDHGLSFGWINHELISAGKILPHINPFGGEERLWLGPEGGQYSIFFSKGKEFIFENWQTPAFIDLKPFELTGSDDTSASFRSDVKVENYSGTFFELAIEREIILLSEADIRNQTGIDIKGLNCVSYRSKNTLINKGKKEWKKETGLLSVWMLGMFNPSPSVIVVIPFREGEEKVLGPVVNDDYFGKISADRLKIAGNHIFFRADGKRRGKIGIPPLRTTGIMGSFDSENNVLTLLICRLPEGKTDFVNSSWQIQEKPYSGDAFNSYNDGPLEDGSQMGPFYELETSSPAAALKPGESLSHIQYTFHITGDFNGLNEISLKTLGIGLNEIKKVFSN